MRQRRWAGDWFGRAGGRAAMDCHACGHQATGSESSDGDRVAHD